MEENEKRTIIIRNGGFIPEVNEYGKKRK